MNFTCVDHCGLENNSVRCYLNSVFQNLYHTEILKKCIFDVNENEVTNLVHKSFLLNLKKFFATLQVKSFKTV